MQAHFVRMNYLTNIYISKTTVNNFMLGSLGFPEHETARPTFKILQNDRRYLACYVDCISEDTSCLVLAR